ncbi:PEP-CTERM sorting domain-containing protein [Alienimonas californiensis]|uniref:Ice-binding protein C-terminal domain-containing protein n=1 Tax=Alienimonas californiensis TaxID=2527989 RepID=A0A517PEB7_9PLAN|nr:PEP-CTERM sorting domain-containing protein [Alienimonas californiensis]QDT17717.1 hypothetical protein CA12_38480 [Alienimonas californiensis]
MSRTLLSVAVAWFGASVASGDLIVAFQSKTSSGTVPAGLTGAGVIDTPLERGGGLKADSGGTFSSTGWTVEGDVATAIAAGDFLTWGFTSDAAYDLTDLGIRYDRTFSGPGSLAIDLSVNGGNFERVFSDDDVDATGETLSGIDLSRFSGVTSATFRLAGWDALLSTGLFEIENDFTIGGASYGIVVNGDVAGPAAVPEPGAALLLGLAGAGGWLLRRRTASPRGRRPLNADH